jgi:hypothetical protein
MKQLHVITWPLRIAIGGTLAAMVLVSTAGWRATHFDKMPAMSTPPKEKNAAEIGSYRPALISELDRAVDLDPFHPERRRPQIRYELPGNAPVEKPQANVPVPDPIELLGTVVVAGGRSFAMCQSSAGTQVVHVGEKIAGFTLKSVGQGNAVFVSPDGRVMNVIVKKTGS